MNFAKIKTAAHCFGLFLAGGLSIAQGQGRIAALVLKVEGPSFSVSAEDSLLRESLHVGDILREQSRLETEPSGKILLRLPPDQSMIELRSNTSARFHWPESGKPLRRIRLDAGLLILQNRRKGAEFEITDENTRFRTKQARVSVQRDDKGVMTAVVLEGELEGRNRPKDQSAVARAGQKAISDATGIKIVDATDAELEAVGLRQNVMEIGFVVPGSEEVSNLEVEYESNF